MNDSTDKELHLNRGKFTYLLIRTILVEFSIKVIKDCLEMYLFKLKICFCKGIAHSVLSRFHILKVLFQFIIVNNILQPIKNAGIVFFQLFRERYT
jgi:hypothetical protein